MRSLSNSLLVAVPLKCFRVDPFWKPKSQNRRPSAPPTVNKINPVNKVAPNSTLPPFNAASRRPPHSLQDPDCHTPEKVPHPFSSPQELSMVFGDTTLR